MSNGLVVSTVPIVEVDTNVLLVFVPKVEGPVVVARLPAVDPPSTPDSAEDAGSFAFSAAAANELLVGEREDEAAPASEQRRHRAHATEDDA